MPVIPRANTNLASMMIGHRAADVITSYVLVAEAEDRAAD
jgi:choline dehydrogenase-like flavoprotein